MRLRFDHTGNDNVDRYVIGGGRTNAHRLRDMRLHFLDGGTLNHVKIQSLLSGIHTGRNRLAAGGGRRRESDADSNPNDVARALKGINGKWAGGLLTRSLHELTFTLLFYFKDVLVNTK